VKNGEVEVSYSRDSKIFTFMPPIRRRCGMRKNLRKSGIDIIGDMPWGTHFCQFYQTKEDLMEILVPYFKAGLKNNEFCIWITSNASEAEEAKETLRRDVPDLDTYLEKGQIEIISYSHGYVSEGGSDSDRILNCWLEKLDKALANGYDGLRLTESTFWLEKKDLNGFADYGEKLDNIISNYQMIAMCTYLLDRCNATEIIEVVANHQFALIKRGGKWEQIESSRRKKVEEKIRNLANIVEFSNDAIITKALDGTITSWNKGAEQIYGHLAKEVLGKNISILDPPILVGETKELTELIKQGDRIHNYETLRVRKDGRIINVSLALSPIFDASGELSAISTIARDITRSKKAEEKLQKSEERYRIVTEQTGQVIYECDLRTNKSIWAGAIEEVTGYSFEEFQKFGKDVWIKNIHLEDINVDEKIQKVRQTGSSFREELRLRRKDGACIFIENNGICLTDHEGHPYGAIGVLKDITNAKLAEIQLKESERKYRSFIKNFHGIAFQRDEHFVPVFLDGAVEEITGYSEKEFMSQIKWKDIVHSDDLALVLNEEEKIRDSPSVDYEEIEYRIKHRNEKIRWVNEIYQKIQRKDGEPEFYQGTIYDVTEKKETKKFLANIETARKKEIHHRIKNNLQVISSLLDLQAERFKNREISQTSEVIEAFLESQNRVRSMALIHEELYRGSGLDTLNFSLYIEELVRNLFQTYRLENADTRLNMDLQENIFFDMDTAVPLGIIVNELVSNSLKYAFPGRNNGTIQIKLGREEFHKCEENAAGNNIEDLKGTGFILTVSDNGIGIPESICLANPDSLGIQLVTALVDQLEGKLKLKTDNGTEFTIMFTVA
jgi:PAS domain S-box-containing protein